MIIAKNVYKKYQGGARKWILEDVNFVIPDKVSVGLIGHNGAGKSTLLRMIGGIEEPTKGSIVRTSNVSWTMGFGGGLQGSLTGRQNAKFVCRILGYEEEMSDIIKFIEDFAEIGVSFDKPVNSYSAGMKSRLQFGMSLAFKFDVYISDEVTSTGDANFKKKASKAFKELTSQSSIIMVSHSEGTLKEFCQSGLWINKGKAYWFDDINEALNCYKKEEGI